MSVTLKELKRNLNYIFQPGVKTPPFIWGKPGLGKSDAFRQIAKALGIDFIDLRLSQLESADLRGIPVPDMDSGVAKWMPPEFLPFKDVKAFNDSKGGILLLDEFNRARPDVLQAAFQLVLDRKVGLHEIRDDWYIAAAGNLGMEDGTDVVELDSALKNRFIHFHVKPDLNSWIEWAEDSDVHPDIINFIRGKATWLYPAMENDARGDDKVFVTPRSWEKFSDILKSSPNIDPAEITTHIGTDIIDGAAGAFLKYLETKDIVSGKDVALDYKSVKNKIKVMQRDQVHSLNNEVVSYMAKNFTKMGKDKSNKAVDNVHTFATEMLEKDVKMAFFQNLAKACQKEDDNKFIDVFLDRYLDDAREVIKLLSKKR